MRTARLFTAALLAGTATLALSLPASAAPLLSDAILSSAVSASSNVENVQYYPVRRYGYGPGYRRGYYGRGYGGTAAGVGIGLAAGAIIGGAIAASSAQAQQNAAYCAQRYRSYDPRSGTYLNRDGNRYPCP